MQDEELEKLIREKKMISARDFSRLTGLPPSTLRYYDDEGILEPAARDKFSKYRYYMPQQMSTVNFIRQCLGWGVSLTEIRKMLKRRDPAGFKSFLRSRRRTLTEQLKMAAEQMIALNVYEELIDSGLLIDEDEICVREMPAIRIRLGGENDFQDGHMFYETLAMFLSDAPKISHHLPVIGYFSGIDTYLAEPTQPTRFALIDPTGDDERPEGSYLVGYARGYYGQPASLPSRLRTHAAEHGLEFEGPVFKTYVHDEMCVREPARYLFQVAAKIKR